MLYYQTIEPATLGLLKSLQALEALRGARLVGGTALALQIGHRKSVDLDFFGKILLSSEELRDLLSESHELKVVQEGRNINIYKLDQVKVDFVNYRYEWITGPVVEDGIVLADTRDIAAMKVNAIIGRGTKKDFIDLYFLLRIYPLSQIIDFYFQKYPDGNPFIALKSLSYFGDAESDPMPPMLIDVSWDEMKRTIRQHLVSLQNE